MNTTSMYCIKCYNPTLQLLSTTNDLKYYCTNCDLRFEECVTWKDVRDSWMKEARLQDRTTIHEFIDKYLNNKHLDYNTMCYAIAAMALAVSKLGSKTFGISGFQASFIMWDYIREWMFEAVKDKDLHISLRNADDLMYPQTSYKYVTITQRTAEWLKTSATEHLKSFEQAHPEVIKHWQKLSEGWLPENLKVKD